VPVDSNEQPPPLFIIMPPVVTGAFTVSPEQVLHLTADSSLIERKTSNLFPHDLHTYS